MCRAGRLGNGPMQRAVDALADRRPLGILGLRASSALAEYLGYFARRYYRTCTFSMMRNQ